MGVFSGDHPLPDTTDGMATPGLLQGMHVRSLVVEDPACCVLQPKKKKPNKQSKAAAPTQHSIHNVWVTERSEPLPLTPALEQGLRLSAEERLAVRTESSETLPRGPEFMCNRAWGSSHVSMLSGTRQGDLGCQ